MIIIRSCKTLLVAATALFFTLVAFGNITDYDSNWQFVHHVLSMDTTFPNSALHWRAIADPEPQKAAYWLIIATQIVVAILLWLAAFRLLADIRTENFVHAKALAIAGLTIGLLLYMVGFVIVGGEWFAMWQSPIWNGQQKAFEFINMFGMVLIVILVPEQSSHDSKWNI